MKQNVLEFSPEQLNILKAPPPELKLIWDDTSDQFEQPRRELFRRDYARYLYTTQQWHEFFALLDQGEYGREKLKWEPTAQAYCHDLELGRRAAAHSPIAQTEGLARLPALFRYSLLKLWLMEWFNQLPHSWFIAMVLLGGQAEQIARLRAERLSNPYKQPRVAQALASLSAQPFTQSQAITQATAPNLSHSQEALMLAEQTQYAEAVSTALALDDLKLQEKTLRQIAVCMTTAGQLELALSVVARLNHKDWGLYDLVSELAKAQLFDQALALALKINDREAKPSALSSVAGQLAIAGQRERAIGLFAQAKALLDQTIGTWSGEDREDYYPLLASLLEGMIEVGLVEEAAVIARQMPGSYDGSKNLEWVATAMAVAGQAQLAVELAHLTRDIGTLAKVSVILARQGQVQEALEVVENMDNHETRHSTLSDIALELVRQGQLAQGRKLLGQIEKFYKTQRDFPHKWLRQIIPLLVAAGKFEQALSVLETSNLGLQGGEFKQIIAVGLAQAGQIEQALELVRRDMLARDQAPLFSRIALILEAVGQTTQAEQRLEEAISAARYSFGDKEPATAFQQVGAAIARLNDQKVASRLLEKVSITARNLRTESEQVAALCAIAEGFAESGRFAQAQKQLEETRQLVEKWAESSKFSMHSARNLVKTTSAKILVQAEAASAVAKSKLSGDQLALLADSPTAEFERLVADFSPLELARLGSRVALSGKPARGSELFERAVSKARESSNREYRVSLLIQIGAEMERAAPVCLNLATLQQVWLKATRLEELYETLPLANHLLPFAPALAEQLFVVPEWLNSFMQQKGELHLVVKNFLHVQYAIERETLAQSGYGGDELGKGHTEPKPPDAPG